MNFVKHEKTLKKLLTTKGGKGYSGNYIYSRDEKDNTLKIGMSEAGLWGRLKNAKSCYPFKHEFWLKYAIISLDGHYTKGKKSTTRTIENALHLESKNLTTVTMEKEEGKRPREYRIFSNNRQLYNLLKKTLNKHRDSWDYLVVFSTKGWHIVANDREVNLPIKTITSLKPKNKDKQPDIFSLPLNNTYLALPKGLKVGDKVPKSDNWEAFTVMQIISKKHIIAKFKRTKTLFDVTIPKNI
jgi:hypothetical protein